jgi:hypothetical protein
MTHEEILRYLLLYSGTSSQPGITAPIPLGVQENPLLPAISSISPIF